MKFQKQKLMSNFGKGLSTKATKPVNDGSGKDKKALIKTNQTQKRLDTQKYGYCAEQLHENLYEVFGTRPAKTVLADTNMVKDIVDLMETSYDKDDMSLCFP